MKKSVAVFGMGYVGCVSAACLARDGHRVLGVDIDEEKLAAINAGRSPISEPGLDDLIAEQVRAGRLSAVSDAAEAVRASEVALIAVGTPSANDGGVQSRVVEAVIVDIGRALSDILSDGGREYTVVVRSTLLPGILEDRLWPLLKEQLGASQIDRVHMCNNPEFLREASALRDYDHPPFIVVGAIEPGAAENVLELYDSITAERIETDTRTAAMVKYACNAFHALKVGFANEIGALARELGADGRDVMGIVCRDTRLNISPAYLRPGFAFGGSCLPKDVRALTRFAQQQAIRTELLDAILPSNSAHLERAWEMIRDSGYRRIGLVGLSFKAGTDDLRESPQVILAETLLGRGYDLKVYDPGVRIAGLVGSNLNYIDRHLPHLAALLVDRPEELADHAELLVLATSVAVEFDWSARNFGRVIDLRRDLVTAMSHAVNALEVAAS